MLEVQTQLTTRYAVIQYERGFDIVEIEGWVEEEPDRLLVFGDRERPARRQRHTMLPLRRVIEVDFLVADV